MDRGGRRQARVTFCRIEQPVDHLRQAIGTVVESRADHRRRRFGVGRERAIKRTDVVDQGPCGLPLFANNLPTHQVVGLDAGGTLVDRGAAGIAEMLARTCFLDISHAAVDLHAEEVSSIDRSVHQPLTIGVIRSRRAWCCARTLGSPWRRAKSIARAAACATARMASVSVFIVISIRRTSG